LHNHATFYLVQPSFLFLFKKERKKRTKQDSSPRPNKWKRRKEGRKKIKDKQQQQQQQQQRLICSESHTPSGNLKHEKKNQKTISSPKTTIQRKKNLEMMKFFKQNKHTNKTKQKQSTKRDK
jgi:hypothetical protein